MKNQINPWVLWLIILLFCLACFGWMAHDAFDLTWPGAVLVGLLFFGLMVLIIVPASLKAQMIKSLPDDLQPVAATPDEFPELDNKRFEALTSELLALGCVPLCDYSINSESVQMMPIFARALLHDEHHCVIEINQYFPPGKSWPVGVTVQSFFGSEPPRPSTQSIARAPLPDPGAPQSEAEEESDFWMLVTHNQPPHTVWKLLRRPRLLSRRISGAGATEILREHLADRAKVAALLKMPPMNDLTIEHYFAWAYWLRRLHREKLRRTNFYLQLLPAYFDKREAWWGELAPEIQMLRQKQTARELNP